MKTPRQSLLPDEPVRAGLLRIAAALIGTARERIAHPSSDRGEDVHDVRTAIKRLRALLRLIRPVIGKTRFTREDGRLRNAARQLAVAREHTVARRTLAALAATAPRRRERQALAMALAGFTSDAARQAATEKAMHAVARRLALIGRGLRGLRFTARGWPALAPGLRKTCAQARQRMCSACPAGDDEAFHRWRVRVKNLDYQLQLLEPIWPRHLGRMLARLRRLQEKLGDDHDLAVVERLLGQAPDTFGGAGQVECVVHYLRQRSRKLRHASEPLGQAILREKPRSFARKLARHWKRWSRRDLTC